MTIDVMNSFAKGFQYFEIIKLAHSLGKIEVKLSPFVHAWLPRFEQYFIKL